MAAETDAEDITVKRDEYVAVLFGDGRQCRFDLLELRLNCPCATCRGMRDAGVDVWPGPASPQPLRIEGAELVGAWGLGLAWNDGHATGIYPWESLRRWCEAGRPSFPADSGLPGSEDDTGEDSLPEDHPGGSSVGPGDVGRGDLGGGAPADFS